MDAKNGKKNMFQGLLDFSECLEKETFTCDWVEGSSDGFKKEHFIRVDKHESHEKCMQKYESILGTMANRAGDPNVCQALCSKLNAQTKAQLGTKFIFIASNLLAYHHIGINNCGD